MTLPGLTTAKQSDNAFDQRLCLRLRVDGHTDTCPAGTHLDEEDDCEGDDGVEVEGHADHTVPDEGLFEHDHEDLMGGGDGVGGEGAEA